MLMTCACRPVILALVATSFSANAQPDLAPRDTGSEWLDIDQLLSATVVSVSRQQQIAFETPAAVQVIQNDDIERFGARSFAEALRLAPGVHVARINSHRYAISIRGFTDEFANKLLVMQDGRSLYTPQFSGTFWDVQDTFINDVEQIEVVRGSGGAAWGANAVNGVINVITKGAEETQGLLVTGGGGTEEETFGGVRYGGQAGEHTFYRVFGQGFQRGDTKFADGTSANDDWYQARGGFRVDSQPSEGPNRFRLSGEYYAGEENQIIFTGPDVIDVSGGHVVGGWEHEFGPDSLLKLDAYYDAYRRDSGQGIGNADQFSVSLDHGFGLGEQHRVSWGAEYRTSRDDLVTPPELAYVPASRQLQFISFYAQDEWRLVDQVRLTAGIKAEHNDYTGWEPLPNFRLAWTPSDRRTAWAGVSRAVRVPSRSDDDLTVVLPGFTSLPNPDLPPEQLWAYETGYRIRASDQLTLDAAVFFNDYDNLRTSETTVIVSPPSVSSMRDSKMSGQGWGGELSVTWQPTDWWRWQGNYSYLEMDLTTDPDSTDLTSANAAGNVPQHQFLIRTSLNLLDDLALDVAWRWVDRLPALNVGDYHGLDVRLGWQIRGGLELALVGQNLVQTQHAEFRASPVLPPASEVERGVYAKVRWEY